MTGDKASHDFSRYLSPRELDALAEFLDSGLADGRRWTGQAGDPGPGEPMHREHCGGCHGGDGRDLDFKPGKEGVQGVGWLARKNPQETLHEILWGHPGSDMPSLIGDAGLDRADAAGILWYAAGLP